MPIIISLICVFITSIFLNILDMLVPAHYSYFKYYDKLLKVSHLISAFSYNAGFFNLIYNNMFTNFAQNMYLVYVKSLDRGVFEYFGPNGMFLLFRNLHYYYKN